VGRGKVGRALQRALSAAGIDCRLVAGRAARFPGAADVYLLAVPDARIRDVASRLTDQLGKAHVVLHCAGARDARELDVLAARGVATGVFHPLLSFAGARPSFVDATFTVLGVPRARRTARHLARALGARVVQLEAPPGPAYHAAAALLANGAAALAHLSAQVLAAVGFSPRAAEHALAGLLHSVAHNIDAVGVPAALTGPVSRGDGATVSAHLAALVAIDPKLARAYRALQPAILDSARAQGLAPSLARKVERALK
jgi:predicted short-subunit dehydrogenase-like oxidoreductase (DUF2520 family)